MVEDLGEAFDFVLGVGVQCVLGGGVVVEEAVLGGLEPHGRVIGDGAFWLLDCGDGAVAGVGYGVVEVADGFVGEFMLRAPLVFFGDALLSVDVPLLQVRPDVGYLRPAVVYVVAVLRRVGVEEGCQSLLRMPEFMQPVSQGCGWLVVLTVGLLLETAGDSGRAHGCEHFGGVRLVAPGAVYGHVLLGPGLFVVQWGHFQGRW